MSEGGPERASAETPSSAATPVATGLRDGAALGGAKLLAALLAIIALKAQLRVTDEMDYGRYATFLLVSNFAIAFTTWPVGSVLRLGSNEWLASRRLPRTYFLHLLLVLGAGLLLAAPLWQARDYVDRYVTVPGATWIILAYALVTAVANVSAALLKPAGRVAQFALLPLVTRVFYVAALGWFAHERRLLDARQVMFICLATALPQLVAGLLLVARLVLPPAAPDPKDADTAVRFGLPVLLRQLGAQSFTYVNIAAIKHYRGLVAMGQLNVANSLAEQTALLGSAIEDLMGPILARAAAEGDDARLRTYYSTIAPQIALFWSTACGVAIVLAPPIIAMLSSRNVSATAPALQILLLATAVRIMVSVEAPVFDAHLVSLAPLAFYLVGFATNLGLDVYLVPGQGIEGAAWASVAGWSVNALLRSGYLGMRFRVPSPVVFLYLLPAAVAFAYARTLGGSLHRDMFAALTFVALALLAGKLSGLFSPASLAALEGVRMPARVRRFLAWFHGASS